MLGSLMYEDGVKYGGAWNFGPNDESIITVEELVKFIIKYWGGGSFMMDTLDHPHEAGILKLDTIKARVLLGWEPIYDAYEAIKRSVNWYKNYYNGMEGEELYKFTVEEIKEYMGHINEKYKK